MKTNDAPINHADLLALLEDGPKRAADLAARLGVTRYALVGALNQLTFECLVRRVGKLWALETFEPVVPDSQPSVKVSTTALQTDQQPLVEQASGSVRVINGQEFESIWDGRGALPGSGEAKGLGSTLSGNNFKVYL